MQALKLSSAARKNTTIGEIVNIMSVDAQKIMEACWLSSTLIEVPISVAICMYFLWQTIGPSAIAGLVLMVIVLPLSGGVLGNKVCRLQVWE